MKNIFFALFTVLFLGHISALCGVVQHRDSNLQQRCATDTWVDPSLTVVYVEAYSHQFTLHVRQRGAVFVHQDTVDNSDWQIQEEPFRAWPTAQPFTFPLYALANPPSNDWIYRLSTNGTTPVVSGFPTASIIAYAYSTQVCGSLPLLALAQTTIGDRYFTTDQDEHDMLVGFGWLSQGIVAYVMPVYID